MSTRCIIAVGISALIEFLNVASYRVRPYLCDEPVQTFQTFISDLERVANWLVATGTSTVVINQPAGGLLRVSFRLGRDIAEWSAYFRSSFFGVRA